jgi:hypothetical protein
VLEDDGVAPGGLISELVYASERARPNLKSTACVATVEIITKLSSETFYV